MRLGIVDIARGKSACYLCGQVYEGSDIKADLLSHLRDSHHRVMLDAEAVGKQPTAGEEDRRAVVINGPRWHDDLAG